MASWDGKPSIIRSEVPNSCKALDAFSPDAEPAPASRIDPQTHSLHAIIWQLLADEWTVKFGPDVLRHQGGTVSTTNTDHDGIARSNPLALQCRTATLACVIPHRSPAGTTPVDGILQVITVCKVELTAAIQAALKDQAGDRVIVNSLRTRMKLRTDAVNAESHFTLCIETCFYIVPLSRK